MSTDPILLKLFAVLFVVGVAVAALALYVATRRPKRKLPWLDTSNDSLNKSPEGSPRHNAGTEVRKVRR